MNGIGKIALTCLLLLAPAIANADAPRWNWQHGYHGNYQPPRSVPHYGYSNPRYSSHNTDLNSALGWGVRSGALSNAELRELRGKQQSLRKEEAAYWADGRLDKHEAKDLRNDYRDFRNDLQHELNDGERRESYRRWHW